MGTCKDEMKPTKTDEKSMFGKIMSRKKGTPAPQNAQTFVDLLEETDKKLTALIVQKRAELGAEKGREDYNRLALARLETMGFHLENIIELAAEYSTS